MDGCTLPAIKVPVSEAPKVRAGSIAFFDRDDTNQMLNPIVLKNQIMAHVEMFGLQRAWDSFMRQNENSDKPNFHHKLTYMSMMLAGF